MEVLCLVLVLFNVMHYFVSFLVLQSSWRGRESWLLYFNCLPDVLWLLVFFGFSSKCRGLVFNMWLRYFLIILTYCLVFATINICSALRQHRIVKKEMESLLQSSLTTKVLIVTTTDFIQENVLYMMWVILYTMTLLLLWLFVRACWEFFVWFFFQKFFLAGMPIENVEC